ncbi:MAG: polysaccharide deacetylase family protein [Candidatus Eisenbacteria bacterium]
MKLVFVFDSNAWSEPRARWTIATIAPLLDAPWRETRVERGGGAASLRADEVCVFVGHPGSAPAAAAVVIPMREWPAWSAAWLERGQFDGAPLAAPGRIEPPLNERDLPAEWLPALWHAMSREEEREDPRRDQWECYSGNYTRLGVIGLLETPWVNLAVTALRQRLDAVCEARGAMLERVPRWKNGARFAVALSHDVDDVRLRSVRQALRLMTTSRSPGSYATRGGLSALARSVPGGGRDPYAQFERWVGEESRRGFRSTFFVFARPRRAHEYDALYGLGDRVPFEGRRPRVGTMFCALAGEGFEIGLHGSYESWRDPLALAAQRAALARATGQEVLATRQHFLRLDPAETWGAQEQAGFTTDATLGYNEAIGFRAGIAAPFHPWDPGRDLGTGPVPGGGRDLLEVPLTLMDGALFRAMALSPEEAVARTIAHLEAVEAAGGMAGLLWHPNAAAGSLFPGWWDCFIAALDHLAARGAWVTSVGEIAAWWRERARRLSPEEL